MGLMRAIRKWLRDWAVVVESESVPTDAASPADGVVGLVPIMGATGVRNAVDPRFQRFESWTGTMGDRSAAQRRTRRAPPLLGRVGFASVFVGRDGRFWSDAELAQAHRSLERAARWLEREAIRWRAPVNIDLAETYFAAADPVEEEVEVGFQYEGDHEAPFEAHAVVKALASASRAAAALGFADIADLIEQTTARIAVDRLVWLLHLRRAGRSHAVAADQTPIPGVTVAICYAREESLPEPLDGPPFTDPTTVVHEVLHLFGASDKYLVPLSTFPPDEVSDRDVMCLYHSALSRLRVDRLTARELGWLR
jgi:hypothetical protein